MIVNVLKDGTIKEDMEGHVVKYEDAKALYDRLLKGVNRWKNGETLKDTRVCIKSAISEE